MYNMINTVNTAVCYAWKLTVNPEFLSQEKKSVYLILYLYEMMMFSC